MAKIQWLIALLLVGCGVKEEENKPASSVDITPFLTSADFVAGDTDPISKSRMSSEIQGQDDFWANSPDSDDEDEPSCLLDQLGAILVRANKETLGLDATLDLTECARTDLILSERISVTSASLRIAVVATCAGRDFSELDRSPVGDIENAMKCDSGPTRSVHLNLEFRLALALSNTTNGQTSTVATSEGRSIDAVMSNSNGPCSESLENDHWEMSNDCVSLSRDINTITSIPNSETEVDEDFEKLTFSNIKSKNDETSPWFESGLINFTFNDWTGTVTYAGASQAPTFTASNGTDSLSGTLSASSLANDAKRGILKIAGRRLSLWQKPAVSP